MNADYPWTVLYRAAIFETDDEMLPVRLRAATGAIDDRLHHLRPDYGGTLDEWRAITHALVRLNWLRALVKGEDA